MLAGYKDNYKHRHMDKYSQRKLAIENHIIDVSGLSKDEVRQALSEEPVDVPYADDLIKKKKNGKSNK